MEAARREAETAKARSAQSAVAAIPDVDVEVYYAHRAEGYDDMAGVMFSVDLPLFQSKRQDKDYAADVSRSMQAVDQLTLLKREHIAGANAGGAVSGCANGVAATAGRGTTVAASTAGGTDGAISLWTVGASGLLEARRGVLDTELAVNRAEREMARTRAAVNWLIPQELAQ